MAGIPLELVEQVSRGNGLVFVGECLTCAAGQGGQLAAWTAELGRRCGLGEPGAGSPLAAFPAVSQLYEDTHGRQALIQFVRDALAQPDGGSSAAHHLLAALSECRIFVTTCLDRRLEEALTTAGRPPVVLVRNVDVAFADEGRTQVYRMRGAADQPDSLVLTEDDCDHFYDDESSISFVLQGYLARCTILFLGYDLADPNFKRLYRRVTANLDGLARRAYFFGTGATPAVNAWCRRHGIQVIETECEPALRELLAQVTARRAPPARPGPVIDAGLAAPPAPAPLPLRPYKLLNYFGPDDTDIYFARERESLLLTSLIHGHRLTILYGASGTGKTSLLLAGVLPRLQAAEPAYIVIYVRPLENPVEAIRRQVQHKLGAEVPAGASTGARPDSGSLAAYLDAAAAQLGHPLVLLLDQFEEFFMRLGDAARAQFIQELGALADARETPVKIVICLREDWLAYMNELRERIPEVFNIDMRLLPLTLEQARRAIVEPVKRVGMDYAPDLVEQLLTDLCQAHQEAATSVDRSLMPPHLQLVCDALYEQVHTAGRTRIEMSDYAAVGEVSGVLANYIEDALRKHPAAERALARNLLIALVSSQSTRYVSDAATAAAAVGTDEATVLAVLQRLVDQRLVRELDEQHFELAHDSLAAAISEWIGDAERQRKQVQEMVRRQEGEWRQNPAFILGGGRFTRVNQLRDELTLTAGETAFILRAALLYDTDVAAWLARLGDEPAQVAALLDALRDPVAPTRQGAAVHLGAYAQPAVSRALAETALADPAAAVRQAAAAATGRAGLAEGMAVLAAAVSADDPQRRTVAGEALAYAVDAAPPMLAFVPRSLRRQLIVRLGRIRLRRHRPQIIGLMLAGAGGGAIGIGGGMAALLTVGSLAAFTRNIWISVAITGVLVFALMGAFIGACIGGGAAVGSTLAFRRPGLGTLLGAMVSGGASFALLIGSLGLMYLDFAGSALLLTGAVALGGGAIALGAVLPALLKAPWWTSCLSGPLGGIVGVGVGGLARYPLFDLGPDAIAPAWLVLAAGGWIGLWLALFIGRRERAAPYLARVLPAVPAARPPALP